MVLITKSYWYILEYKYMILYLIIQSIFEVWDDFSKRASAIHIDITDIYNKKRLIISRIDFI